MNLDEKLDPQNDRAFNPGGEESGSGRQDWFGRHQDDHSLSHDGRDGSLDGSHSGVYAQASVDHAGSLGWGAAAWGEAGGFEHVLGGGLAEPPVTGPIDHLGAGNESAVQSQATNVLFNTGPGGVIDVGGNVEALANQAAALSPSPSHDFGSLAHNAQVETTDIIFNVATGGAIDIGGNVEALANQSASLSAPQSNDFGSLAHNALTEATNIIFNVASGGTIDVAGNVEASAQQQSLVSSHVATDFAHHA